MKVAEIIRDIAEEAEHVRRRILRLDKLAVGGRVNVDEFPTGRAWMDGLQTGLGAANLMLLKRYASSDAFDDELDEVRLLWELYDPDDPAGKRRLSGEQP